MLTRRQLLRTGVCGGVLLVAAAWVGRPAEAPPAHWAQPLACLTPAHATLLAAMVPVMLAVDGVAVARVVQGVDQTLQGMPLAVRREVRQLFDLLANPWGRRYLAGVKAPWPDADPASIAAFLRAWQHSRLALLRSGYQALHALIAAAWYGDSASWAAIGYQRPARIMGWLR